MDKVRQYAIDLLKLSIEGPMILQVVPRDGLHRGDKGTAALLRDAPLLSESGGENLYQRIQRNSLIVGLQYSTAVRSG